MSNDSPGGGEGRERQPPVRDGNVAIVALVVVTGMFTTGFVVEGVDPNLLVECLMFFGCVALGAYGVYKKLSEAG